MRKTTKKQFRQFVKACQHYQKKLGLLGWKLYFEHTQTPDCFAQIAIDHDGRVCTVKMASEVPPQNWQDVKPRCQAKHEMIHLLLSRLQHLARSRYTLESEIEEEWEAVTRVLEKLIR